MKYMSICCPKASVTFCSSSLIFSGLWNGMILGRKEVRGQSWKMAACLAQTSTQTLKCFDVFNTSVVRRSIKDDKFMTVEGEMKRSGGSRRGARWCQRSNNRSNDHTQCQLVPHNKYKCLIYWTPTCMTVCTLWAYQQVFAVSVYTSMCVFVKLYMHECASQSVCASATVSTPLGLSTKPAQRQMGNFLRGKRGGVEKSGAAAKAAGCVSFPPLLKSDRVKDTETWRYLQTCERENTGDSLTK